MKLFLILILLVSPRLEAFVNVQSESFSQSQKGIQSNVSVHLKGSEGNTVKSSMGLQAKITWRKGVNESLLSLTHKTGSTSKNRDVNQSVGHYRFTRFFSDSAAWEGFAQAESDEFKRLDLRTLVGVGLRMRLIDTDKSKLDCGLGAFLLRENIDQSATKEFARGNFFASFRAKLNKGMSAGLSFYFQPKIDELDYYNVKSNAYLKSSFNTHYSVSVKLEYANDSRPHSGVKRDDFVYYVTFDRKFGG